ncbi:polyribonucleotide nucleotidyltransferase [Candidatus Saccharibacteria bacterium]|nr:MAG: polyribonucleotide nucleotidyltransferase [Candidatus Saccharibacteria bacterium]PID98917.1 MAG: polyribonucleotide nucleotidyltransferase [Candidatus Saccharibacteria bacterium]
MSQTTKTINPYGKNLVVVETEFCGRTLSLEVNRVGFRTTASVIARYGDTVVLGTAMLGKPVMGMDYFPLSIDYEEKFYAAGKISGSRFIKREGRPSDDAILIGRLIDRPIRPLWPKGYRNEVQGVASVLSMDPSFRPDMVAMIAMSAAFMLTGAPFDGPVAGVRVGMNEAGEPQAFMSAEELDANKLDLVVAGREGGIMMVEAGANEATEEEIVAALTYAEEAIKPALALQKELVEEVGVEAQAYELVLPDDAKQQDVDAWVEGKIGAALRAPYPERNEMIGVLREQMHKEFAEKVGEEEYTSHFTEYDEALTMALHKDVRAGIVKDGTRPDGRKLTEIRPLSSEVGLLPRAHGSSLFTRGVTQGLNVVTLAPLSYAQLVDTMEKNMERRYMHHYNAPGYTVGEVRRLGSPGRREIGHGYLAERALFAVLPDEADFPYAIRSVTEIMSQNGSTSMAATCASCLALMDAGVPLKAPVSGIAMGLMVDGDNTYILSDIADAEDFAGDMDFKVAGTSQGITALQMDMKVHGLPVAVLAKALEQGKEGRAAILQHMLETLSAPRDTMSPYAPRVESISINPDKIRDIIGKGGETIQKITAETGTEIDIKDDGTVMIASPDGAAIQKAKDWIGGIVEEPEVGKIYVDKPVVSVLDFGAFVQILPGKDGLVHVSEMSEERVNKPSDVVKEGDLVTVKLVAIDDRGRLQLSMKAARKELKQQ